MYFIHYFHVSVTGDAPKCPIAELSHSEKGSPYSTAERRVLKLIPVFGRQPAGNVES